MAASGRNPAAQTDPGVVKAAAGSAPVEADELEADELEAEAPDEESLTAEGEGEAVDGEGPGGVRTAGEAPTHEQVETDLDELVGVAAQRDEYLALAQRTQADFENYRKRMGREVAAAEARGMARLAKELLPALDNIQRALDAAESPTASADPSEPRLAEGIRLVQADLRSALTRLGIEMFSPQGEPFDPNQHEAMAQHPVDGTEAGTVVEVYEPGYRLGDSVIRPARVVVAG